VTSAASEQLSVPVIAALGGIVLLGEPLTLRLVIASSAILGALRSSSPARRAPPEAFASAVFVVVPACRTTRSQPPTVLCGEADSRANLRIGL
jgi:hypothetical protein